MRIKIGIIDSLIQTDNEKILKVLSDKWAFHQKGYQYVKSYRRSKWDGKKRFITMAGRFKTGMLNLVLKDLEKVGCTPELDYDFVNPPAHSHKSVIGSFTLVDYQEEAIKNCIEKKRCVIKSPTGSGKTLIMAALISCFPDSQITILFDERLILTQTYDFLKKEAKFKDIGICMGGDFVRGRVMLCMIQSIEKIIDSHVATSQVLMVDEVHKFCNGATSLAAIQSFPQATYRYGFTATIPDDKIAELNLIGAFGDIVGTRTTQELIESGRLAKPDIQLIEHVEPYTQEDEELSFRDIYTKFVVRSEVRNNLIIELCRKIKESGKVSKVCVLVRDLEHLNFLLNNIEGSYSLEGSTKQIERQLIIENFINAKETQFLIGTKVLQTGVNIKEITHLVNARGLKDKIPTIQGLGRGLRVTEEKKTVMVYDFFDDIPYLKKHSKNRIKHYKNEGHEIKWIKL